MDAIKSKATTLFAAKDYDGLESLATQDQAMDSPFASGALPINLFYLAIDSMPESENVETAQAVVDALQAWVDARPNSVTAKIALADALSQEAWVYRGSGYANTVSQDGWDKFGEKLKAAATVLESIKDQRKSSPRWYRVNERVGLGLQYAKQDFLDAANEGTAAFPKSIELYDSVEAFLLPRWYGSYGEMLDYATKAADTVGGDNGDILYARIAMGIWKYSCDTEPDSMVGFSWHRLKHGMELICKQHPHSAIALNFFALFASQETNRPLTKVLLDHIGTHYIGWSQGGPWNGSESFDSVKKWAYATSHDGG